MTNVLAVEMRPLHDSCQFSLPMKNVEALRLIVRIPRSVSGMENVAMFCSECGKPAHGKFCSLCGAPLAVAAVTDVVPTEIVPDWDGEVKYETILKYPGVRDAIERNAKQAP